MQIALAPARRTPPARTASLRAVPFASLRDDPFTEDQPLAAMILRMLNTNALAAFGREIAPTGPTLPVRGPSPVPGQVGTGQSVSGHAGASPQGTERGGRSLDAVPPPPARPLPRGSLLDLRV